MEDEGRNLKFIEADHSFVLGTQKSKAISKTSTIKMYSLSRWLNSCPVQQTYHLKLGTS